MSYNAKNYAEQGGDVTHIGGQLVIEEGASVEGLPSSALPEATETEGGAVKKAANQADSEASTIATLKDDFNALLLKLKTAGIMAADEE